MAYPNRIVGHDEVEPAQLLANPRNYRIHPSNQEDALSGVLAEVGWVDSVLVNRRTGFVIDGHLRVAHAISQNEPSVPVDYVDLSEEEEALVLATFDPLSAMAATDSVKLRELTANLKMPNAALDALVADVLKRAPLPPKSLNPDDADLTPPAEPITKLGDLWLLGGYTVCPKCGHHNEVGS